jgi:hypothetical protein
MHSLLPSLLSQQCSWVGHFVQIGDISGGQAVNIQTIEDGSFQGNIPRTLQVWESSVIMYPPLVRLF